MNDLEYAATYRYIVREDETAVRLWHAFKRNPRRKQRWRHIHPDYLAESWLMYIYGGKQVPNRIELMVDRALSNVLQLRFNTIIAGHTEMCPIVYLSQYDITATPVQIDRFLDHIEDPITGHLWISDFGIRPIEEILFKLLQEQSTRQQLLMIYRILNVRHCRSDLSSFFIKGGLKAVAIEP